MLNGSFFYQVKHLLSLTIKNANYSSEDLSCLIDSIWQCFRIPNNSYFFNVQLNEMNKLYFLFQVRNSRIPSTYLPKMDHFLLFGQSGYKLHLFQKLVL